MRLIAHANPAEHAPTSAPRRDGEMARRSSASRRAVFSFAVASVERRDAFSSFTRALEVRARLELLGESPSRERSRWSRASAHTPALVVGPLDRAIHALPHGRAAETARVGAGAVTAGKGMLPRARGRGDEHGIRGRTDGAEDTENQHSDRQFAARHAPDALLAKGTTVTLSESRALHEWPIESAFEASEQMR